MTLSKGDQIGQYEIIEQIGSGGMATVYKAYHARLDRHVAIKIMHQTFMQEPDFHTRFEREARIVANLDHPNIVSVYDYDEHQGQPYLVMKFIEGETLKSVLRDGAISLERIQQIMPRLAAALTYAHSLGILHRDIKPSNIMIDARGEPYLTDFGLARIAQMGESTMSADMMLGTPQYISPEQAQGLPNLTSATDVYSLGIILYELVTGQVPFVGDNTYAIVHKQIYAAPPAPSELYPDIPPEVEDVLLRALQKDPKARYATPTAMIDAFGEAVRESGLRELDEERISQARSRIVNIDQHTPRGGNYVGIPAPVDSDLSWMPDSTQSAFQNFINEVIVRFKEAALDIQHELRTNEFFQGINQRMLNAGIHIDIGAIGGSKSATDTPRDSQSRSKQVVVATDVERDWGMSEVSVRRRVNRRMHQRQGFLVHVVIFILAIGGLTAATPAIQEALREFLTHPDTVVEVGGTFLAPLAELPFATILALWWGSGLIAHGLRTFYESGRRWEKRRAELERTLMMRYGDDWRNTITNKEYRRIRKKVNNRYKRRLGLVNHFIGSLFFFLSVGAIWPLVSEVLEGAALANPDFPQNLYQLPVIPIVLFFMAVSLGFHVLSSVIGSVAGEDARERAIDREIVRERERTLAQGQIITPANKLKNEGLLDESKLKHEATPDVRLNEDGELTDSFAQEWHQQDGKNS